MLGTARLQQIEQAAPGLNERQADIAKAAVEQQGSARRRLKVARQLVDEFARTIEPLAACRRGCAHCCHIKVEMTEIEAEQLGAAIKRRPNAKYSYMVDDVDAYNYNTPCPFLAKDHSRSIYEHRPFACRKHHNLDQDEVFCRLDVPPSFNAGVLKVRPNAAMFAYWGAMTSSKRIADIRDWFPGPAELARGPIGRIPMIRDKLEAADLESEA